MRHSPVSKAGFTLIENLVVVIILGIVTAIAVPSWLGLQQRQRLTNAVDMVMASLREAQQRSIERNTRCQLTLEKQQIIDVNHCLSNGNLALPTGIQLATAGLDNSIDFGMKGNTTDNRTIRLQIDHSQAKSIKCIAISAPLGITRQGEYDNEQQICRSKKK
jgi:prepilin-type N-terminal cleavage/methylation domain-containing protein